GNVARARARTRTVGHQECAQSARIDQPAGPSQVFMEETHRHGPRTGGNAQGFGDVGGQTVTQPAWPAASAGGPADDREVQVVFVAHEMFSRRGVPGACRGRTPVAASIATAVSTAETAAWRQSAADPAGVRQ